IFSFNWSPDQLVLARARSQTTLCCLQAASSRPYELGVATFWQRASATSQTERGASGLDQHGRASTARNAPRGKLPAAVTLPRPWVGSSASRNVPSCL